jgi:hypothetical protein
MVKRVLGLALLLALQTACSTLATLHGARTLEPGTVQVGVAASLQHGNNPLATTLAFFPQLELAARYGVREDLDVGMRAFLFGVGGDMRYRFFRSERLDFATAPGVTLFYIPTVGGSAELRSPVLGELQLGEYFSVAGGPALVLRDQWNTLKLADERGLQSRVDVYAGGGGRLEFHGWPIVLGFTLDLYAQPARSAGLAWSAGVDLALRNKKKEEPEPPEG